METIYKYGPIYPAEGPQKIEVPEFCKVLSVMELNNRYYFWAFVDTETPTVELTYFFVGTGWEAHAMQKYATPVGSVSTAGFIWHFSYIPPGTF